MSFEDELQNIPNDVEDMVKGDIQVGKLKIPKIAIVALVVGLVAFLAIKSRKKSSNTPTGGNGLTGSSSDSGLGGSGDNGDTNPLSGLQPLPDNSGNASDNPLGAIPIADIPTPNLTLPDFTLPDLGGYGSPIFGGLPDFSGTPPILGSPDLSSFFGVPNQAYDNTGFTGDSVYQPSITAINSAPAKKVANVGLTTTQAKQTLQKSLNPLTNTVNIINGFLKSFSVSRGAGNALLGGASKVVPNLRTSITSSLLSKSVPTAQSKPVSSVGFGYSSRGNMPILQAPHYTPSPVSNSYILQGANSVHLVGLPPPTNVPQVTGAGSAGGFGGSRATKPIFKSTNHVGGV